MAGMKALFESDPATEVVGVAASVAEAETIVSTTRPDVVLVDFRLPDGTGADLARSILATQPQLAVVFITADPSEENLMAAVDAGASGFLPKSTSPRAIVDAVLRAATGEMLIPAASLAAVIRARSAQHRADAEHATQLARFTPRERDIMTLMVEGLDNMAVAERLVIGVNTVRWHVRAILEKLNAHSKLEAVARAVELGLVRRPGA